MKSLMKKLILPLIFSFLIVFSAKGPLSNNHLYPVSTNYNKEEFYKKEVYYYKSIIKSLKKTIDSIPYFPDSIDYGTKDVFQSPEYTKKKGKGDCEDQAICVNNEANKNYLDFFLVRGKLYDSSKVFHWWNEFYMGEDTFLFESAAKKSYFLNTKKIDRSKKYIELPFEKKQVRKLRKIQREEDTYLQLKGVTL